MPAPNSSESNLERTFADVAYARLRDKAPSMLDYLIGFQLIDKNEEETHAVGIFGFKVGSEWVYAPVFFINGELKGHELMYIKSQDAFVPMTEEWVNYILNRRPSVLGEPEHQDRNEIPLRQPDFDVFARSPYIGSKFASHIRPSFNQIVERMDPDMHGFMPVFHPENWPNGKKYASLRTRFTIPGVLKTFGKRAMLNLVASMRHDEKFANSVLNFYDFAKDIVGFEKAAKADKTSVNYQEDAAFSKCKDCDNYVEGGSCSQVSGNISPDGTCKLWTAAQTKSIEPIEAVKTGSTDADKGPHQDSSGKGKKPKNTIPVDKPVTQEEQDEHGREEEEEVLNELQPALPIKDAALVITQEEACRYDPYLTERDRETLMRDRYLVKDARAEDATSKVYSTQMHTSVQGPRDSGLYDVLRKDGSSAKMLIVTAPIIFSQYGRTSKNGMCVVVDLDGKKYGNYYPLDVLTKQQYGSKAVDDLLSSGIDPKSLKPRQKAVIVGPGCKGTCVFDVSTKSTNSDGQTEFKVWGCDFMSPNASRRNYKTSEPGDEFSSSIETLVITDKNVPKMQQIGSCLYVPKGFKAIVLSEPDTGDNKSVVCCDSPATLDLGNINDFWQELWKAASVKQGSYRLLRILTDGISFRADLNDVQGPPLTKVGMLKTLIMTYGLGKKDAELLVKQAQPRKADRYVVKLATGYGDAPIPAYFPEPPKGNERGIMAPIQYPQTELQNLGQINPFNRDEYRDYNFIDEGAKRDATNASRLGQKEVLDTSVISGLVKTMDSDSFVDSYIGDLLLGLDRLGRILFMFYWHNDKFKDRYGQQDMPEMEDNLRNVFKNLGELALFLKQKTIEPDKADSGEAELTDILVP
jgi:hypothetical protein